MKALTAAALALTLACSPALAKEWDYVGNAFTTEGFPPGHSHVTASVVVTNPLTNYLNTAGGFPNKVSIQGAGAQFSVSDGVTLLQSCAIPQGDTGVFVLNAFLNAAQTDIDWTQGWTLSANIGDSADNWTGIWSMYAGVTYPPNFAATQDGTRYLPAVGAQTLSTNSNSRGTWTEH